MATTTTAPRPRTWLTLLPFLLAVAVVAVVGGLAAGSAGSTYRDLELPPFAPPSWLFGPVWTVLYVMIGVAGWLLWRSSRLGHGPAPCGPLSWWSTSRGPRCSSRPTSTPSR